MKIPIGGGFYQSESLPISAQQCVNFYLNIPQVSTENQETLLTSSGIRSATTAGTVYSRGGHVFKTKPYFVQGEDLYRVDVVYATNGDATYSSVKVNGAVPIPGIARVMFSDNGGDGDQMVIVVPESSEKFNMYIYTEAGGLVAVSDTDFDGPVSAVRFVDGYFLFTKKDGQKFFVSDLRDGSSYLALDFSDAEADPDTIVGPYVLNNTPYIFGEETMQPFQNVGGSGFPFLAIPGGVQRKGLSAQHAIEEVGGLMVFLGKSVNETPAIWATDGTYPQKLSTTAIDHVISGYSQAVIASCFAWKYSQSGARFVGFTFPGEETFVFDFTSKQWHTRQSNDDVGCWRVASIADAYGVFLVSDLINNKIGILSNQTFDEYGSLLPRWFVTPHLENEGDPFFLNAVEIACEAGIGLSSGQGSEPIISLSISKDGGKTFSNKFERKAGRIGEYDKRIIWNSLGRVPRQVCFRFDVSDPVKWVVRSLEARID